MDENKNQKPSSGISGSITPPPLTSVPAAPKTPRQSLPPKPLTPPQKPTTPQTQPQISPVPTPTVSPVATPPQPKPIPNDSPPKATNLPSQQPTKAKESNQPPPKGSQPKIKKSPFRLVGPIIAILMVLGLGWFLATKLFNKKPAVVKDITLTYWGLWEPVPALSTVFTNFETEHPGVKINYVIQSPKDYRERLQAAIDRGQGPDIFRFHNSWVPMLKNELSAIPKGIMSGSEFEKTFYPTTHKNLKISSSYVGIPLEFDGLALYYNKDIFKNANKTPPKTWDETRKLASELALRNQQNRIIRGGIALGTTSNVDHWPDILALMMLQNAANPATPTNERAEDSLAFYTIFSKTDKVWDDTMPSSTIAFAEEKVAMMIAPSWRAFDIKELNPNLNFATVPTPQLTNVNLHWASYWAEGVSSQTDAEKQELAWTLLKFMIEPENLRSFYQDASQIRYFGEPYSRVDMAEELIDDPIVGAYISSAKTAQGWWMSSWTFDNGLNDRIIKYYENAVNAVNGNKTPKRALETTSEGVVQILSQFGVSGAL